MKYMNAHICIVIQSGSYEMILRPGITALLSLLGPWVQISVLLGGHMRWVMSGFLEILSDFSRFLNFIPLPFLTVSSPIQSHFHFHNSTVYTYKYWLAITSDHVSNQLQAGERPVMTILSWAFDREFDYRGIFWHKGEPLAVWSRVANGSLELGLPCFELSCLPGRDCGS